MRDYRLGGRGRCVRLSSSYGIVVRTFEVPRVGEDTLIKRVMIVDVVLREFLSAKVAMK